MLFCGSGVCIPKSARRADIVLPQARYRPAPAGYRPDRREGYRLFLWRAAREISRHRDASIPMNAIGWCAAGAGVPLPGQR